MIRFFVGCYTEMITEDFGGSGSGIYSFALDPSNGKMQLNSVQSEINPSYLAINSSQNILYCIKEVIASKAPVVSAYSINNDQSLTFLNSSPVAGDLPCHMAFHKDALYVACYASGNVLSYPLDENGNILPYDNNYKHKGGRLNSIRQEAPHAHQICFHPNGHDMFVPDLGIDTLKGYKLLSNRLVPNSKNDVSLPVGGGPRHMVFNTSGDLAYVINELNAEVSVIKKSDDGFEFVQSYDSLPPSYKEIPSASAIRIHPNGTYVYTGNRGSETIAIFKVEDEDLQLIELFFIEGKTIREFNISPCGAWLLVACQDSHELISFSIGANGGLTETFRTQDAKSPVCILFQ